MPKRMTDTDKWKKPWFLDLPIEAKVLWQYLCDNCDAAGVWDVNLKLAGMLCGFDYDSQVVESWFEKQIKVFDDGRRWWVPSFVEFQYDCKPEELNPNNLAHRGVLRILVRYNLIEPTSEQSEILLSLSKGHKSPLRGASEGLKSPLGIGIGIGERIGKENRARPEDQKHVARYMLELRPDLDKSTIWKQANKYWDHQLEVGWRVGKTKETVKDWKASVRTWMGNAVDYERIPPKPQAEQLYTCSGCGEKVPWKDRTLHLVGCSMTITTPTEVKDGIDSLLDQMHVKPQSGERKR